MMEDEGFERSYAGMWRWVGPSPCTFGVYSREEETGTLSANSDARHTVIGANSGAATEIWNHIFIWYMSN